MQNILMNNQKILNYLTYTGFKCRYVTSDIADYVEVQYLIEGQIAMIDIDADQYSAILCKIINHYEPYIIN